MVGLWFRRVCRLSYRPMILLGMACSFVYILNSWILLSTTIRWKSLDNMETVGQKPDVPVRQLWNLEDRCWLSLVAQKNISCSRLFQNDSLYITQIYSSARTATSGNMCKLETVSKNCTNLRQFHGYDSWIVTQEEIEFPLAMAIKMHKSVEQAEQLLRTIWRPHNVYCIHVDNKSDPNVFEIIKTVGSCFDNVFVLEKRINVLYGSIDTLRIDLMCMDELSKRNSKWKYYLNFVGQEFVLKTNLEMVNILKMLNGSNDIESYPFPSHNYFRFHHVYIREISTMKQTSKLKDPVPPPFSRSTLRKGSILGCFSRNFVQFVFQSPAATRLLKWGEDMFSPDELFWASVSAISEAPGNVLQNSSTYIDQQYLNFLSRSVTWTWSVHRCVGKYIRSICIYTICELPWLKNQPTIAANKFDEATDQVVLDCLEELLYNRTFKPDLNNLNWNYMKHLPHVVDQHK